MDTSWVSLVWMGSGLIVGAALIWFRLRPRVRALLRETARARRDLGDVAARVADLEQGCRRVVDLVERGIEEPARDASRVIRGRTDVAEQLARAIDELERVMGPTRGDGVVAPLDIEGLARRVEQSLEEHGSRSRILVGEGDGLQRSAEIGGSAASAMTAVILELERGAEGLAQASTQTAEASTLMEDALRRMQGGAGETADISAKVASEAERGYRAVHKTLDEIERIRDLAETARKRIDALGGRVVGIGDVVRVIQEIAEKTNLLALNASIIAAQAGEHGRSFAVVAQEIKALAQKTGTSTKQISEQIRGVQEESERAMEAMAAGVNAVGDGFQVALGAGDALGEIRQSARTAQKKVQAMMRAMDEQAGASRRVVDAANVLAERASALSAVVKEQALHRSRLGESAQGLADGAARVARIAREQLENGQTAADAVTRLVAEAAGFLRGHKDLRRQIDRIHTGASQLSGLEHEVIERIAAMNEAAVQLREELARAQSA